jgi:hypothetical protein
MTASDTKTLLADAARRAVAYLKSLNRRAATLLPGADDDIESALAAITQAH